MKKFKILAHTLCFLGATSLQAADQTGFNGQERTVAHLYMVDMQSMTLALEGNDLGLHVPSHEVSSSSLTDVSIAGHANRVLGLHKDDIEAKNLHLFGQIECVPQNPGTYLESNDDFLSINGLQAKKGGSSSGRATYKVTHLYYLGTTYSKAQTNKTDEINWRSISDLFSNIGKPGKEQVYPREDIEIAALMAKFKETATLDKKSADMPSIALPAKTQGVRVETHLSVPASFISYLYTHCPDAYKAYKNGKEGAEFIEGIALAPVAGAVGVVAAASFCVIV